MIDGSGSSITVGGVSNFGGNGACNVTLSNNAVGSFAALDLADATALSTNFQVLSGADLTNSGNLRLATAIAVGGTGSTWIQTGSSATTIGALAGTRVIVLNVQDGGAFTTGAGSVSLNTTAAINIDGGTLNLRGPLIRNGGVLNFTSGALSIVDDFTVGSGGLLGVNVNLDATRRFTTSATTTFDAFRTLTLNGTRRHRARHGLRCDQCRRKTEFQRHVERPAARRIPAAGGHRFQSLRLEHEGRHFHCSESAFAHSRPALEPVGALHRR